MVIVDLCRSVIDLLMNAIGLTVLLMTFTYLIIPETCCHFDYVRRKNRKFKKINWL